VLKQAHTIPDRGGGCKGHILVLEGKDGLSWRMLVAELRLVVKFFKPIINGCSLLGECKDACDLVGAMFSSEGG
jgi:hypothetical protein